jgi:outer membrane protein
MGIFLTFSGAAAGLDLVEAYEKAAGYDPTMRAAGEAVIAGREKAVQGDALLLPQIQFTAGYSHVEDRSKTDLPPQLSDIIKPESSGNVRQAKVELKQPVYDVQAAANRRQQHSRTDLAELTYRNSRQELIQRVTEAYLNVLFAQENVRVVEAEKAAVGMQRDRAKARFDVGRGKITEVEETQARYDSVLTKEVSARSTLDLRQAQFQELTGTAAKDLAELRPGFRPVPPQPASLAVWQDRSRERNTRVQAKQSELAIAAAEAAKHRMSARPTVDLVASYGHKGQDGGLSPVVAPNGNRQTVIGLQFTVPLFAGGGIDSRERESTAKRREAEHELAAAQRDARLQVQDAFLSVTTGVSRIASLEQSLLSARTALEATTLGRDVGSRTELDVLDAQQRLFSTQLELAQARNDYLVGRIRLASAAGALNEADLQAINAYLVR